MELDLSCIYFVPQDESTLKTVTEALKAAIATVESGNSDQKQVLLARLKYALVREFSFSLLFCL